MNGHRMDHVGVYILNILLYDPRDDVDLIFVTPMLFQNLPRYLYMAPT